MVKNILSPMTIWRHDLTSCLQDDVATILLHYGQDPTIALGAAWDFYYARGDFRREEYYFPCRWPEDPVRSLAPYHPVTSRWHFPADDEAGWQEVKDAISRGVPAIIAVDNYYLPFRPAYQDVNTNHLIVLYGIDEAEGIVHVLDNKPPQYNATIPIDVLHAARGSENPANDRSLYFYTNNPIKSRWLEVEVTGEFPEVTHEWVIDVMRLNLEKLRAVSNADAFCGMHGMTEYLAHIGGRSINEKTGPDAMDELYVVGWAVQQQTALHGDFLLTVGQRLGWHRLAQVGRRINRLAHHWSDLRMLAAHHRNSSEQVAERIARRSQMLLSDQEQVLQQMEWLLHNSRELVKGGSRP